MILEALIVLPQLSVNAQVSVYVPPQAVCDPLIADVTLPDIWQAPLAPLL
jgi:hypothetical protein